MRKTYAAVKNKLIIIIVTLISALGFYFRCRNLAQRELWGDEHMQLNSMNTSLFNMFMNVRHVLNFSADHVLIYPFYQLFGKNKWGLAIPHIIATIIGFYLLYILCRKYFKTTLAYIITFLTVSFNANLIFHAFEIRPYSVLVTLGIAVFLAMQYIVDNKELVSFKKYLLRILFFAVFLFHLYGAYILLFCYVFHLLCSRKESIKATFFRNLKDFGLVVLIAFPLWAYFVIGYDRSCLGGSGTFEFIRNTPKELIKGILGNLIGFKPFYLFAAMLPLAFLIPQKSRFKQWMFLIFLVVIPICFQLLLSTLFKYYFVQRTFVWVMPLFAFLVGWSWDSVYIFFKGELGK